MRPALPACRRPRYDQSKVASNSPIEGARVHARLHIIIVGTSETDSGSLISLIEEWVSGGTGIIMTGVLVTVDSECSVALIK